MRIWFSTEFLKEALRISNSLFSFKGEIQFCSLSHMIRFIDISGFVQKTCCTSCHIIGNLCDIRHSFKFIVPTIHTAGFDIASAKSIVCFWWMDNTLACTAEFAYSMEEIAVDLTKLLHQWNKKESQEAVSHPPPLQLLTKLMDIFTPVNIKMLNMPPCSYPLW